MKIFFDESGFDELVLYRFDGVSVTLPRCHGDQSHNLSLALSWCVPVVKDFSLQKNQNDKKSRHGVVFQVTPFKRAEATLVVIPSTTDCVFLHFRADTCIRDYSSITAIALRLLRSPVLRLVGVVVWLMHIVTKMASSCRSARKEYSPQGNSQAQRQRQNRSFKKSNIPSKRIKNSATAKSSTTGLSR